jgi:hypothetical protein
LRLPDDPVDFLQKVLDGTVPSEIRAKALIALGTHRESEDILGTDSLWYDLNLSTPDLVLLITMLRLSLPPQSEPVSLGSVDDLVRLIEANQVTVT